MPPAPSSPRPIRRLIGYARVSTEDQATDAQVDELRFAGCRIVHEEHGSGASRARPVLAKLMCDIGGGDVLVVVLLDRLARSVSHLLQVIETLEERGAHFRSLRDPIDTSTPQGMFSLQVLGAVAQLERALRISERTKAGIKAAKARGKLPAIQGRASTGATRSERSPRRETKSISAISSPPLRPGCPRSSGCGRSTAGATSSACSTTRASTGPSSGYAARCAGSCASAWRRRS